MEPNVTGKTAQTPAQRGKDKEGRVTTRDGDTGLQTSLMKLELQ